MRTLILLAAAMVGTSSTWACDSAAAWAERFQGGAADFYAGPPSAAVLKQVTPEFGDLLKREAAYADGEIGHLDYDPWLGSQDGDMVGSRFELESETDDSAMVALRFQFDSGDGSKPQPRVAHLVLRKAEGSCWRLADLITPYGESLAYLFSQE
ncbi:hypothetical protein C7S18_10590 [Ahniella affigens]|uniref:DUF3828 domain-containing protein n=1 Tax=Ahniella affigens TaxID=2021234 RepID=A0A2P1PS08_9GAMM|nr:hypothetical protein [Ahniella affigens]AVP97618.1 hypothetical protein C7S18_10590 [Ahniella affigens]